MRVKEEYKSISAKMPVSEVSRVEDYCRRKGTTVSKLLRDAVLREIDVPLPHNIAGNNRIIYDEETDNFNWTVKLDDGNLITVIENVSPEFVEDLIESLQSAVHERNSTIKRESGVPIPSQLGGRKNE